MPSTCAALYSFHWWRKFCNVVPSCKCLTRIRWRTGVRCPSYACPTTTSFILQMTTLSQQQSNSSSASSAAGTPTSPPVSHSQPPSSEGGSHALSSSSAVGTAAEAAEQQQRSCRRPNCANSVHDFSMNGFCSNECVLSQSREIYHTWSSATASTAATACR